MPVAATPCVNNHVVLFINLAENKMPDFAIIPPPINPLLHRPPPNLDGKRKVEPPLR